ncbi:hypothetical protein F2Q70_00012902 [Brassica cretica]|uniref:DUF1985 domain-containing protein n=1 Tax=Brassica cretica TaxID=69181 RepID=A0A8S9LZ41_BRACR|nr:hypothetical protein F2Q70_00012902 [Brassica cretica]
MLGVRVEAGPSTQEIIAAFERCEGWSRDDRKRLAYLAIFTGYIEERKYLTPTRVTLARLVMEVERFENYPWGRVAFKVLMDSVKGKDILSCYTINGFAQALQVWVCTALPELGVNYGNPLPNNLSQPILAYKGRKTRVINFVQKDIGEMFPKWEFDAEDTPAENIIKLMFVKRPWKWTMDCWGVTGTWVNTKPAVVSPAKKKVVKEDSPRPRKKARKEAPAEASEEAPAEASEEVHTVARSEVTTTVGGLTKEDIKTMFKDIVDAMREGFGTCLKEIKYLSERVEAVEKKVGITTKRKGTSSQNTTSPPKPTLEPGWTMDCWEVTSTWVNTKPAVVSPAKKNVVKEDSPRPRKKARKEASEEAAAEASEEVHTTVGGLTKEDIKTMFQDIVDAMREGFGTCLKEIKYLSERVEAVKKKVGITTKRKRTSAQNTTPPPKPTLEPGSESVNGTNAGRKSLPEDKSPDQSPYTANSRAKVIIPNKKLYPGYNPFAPIDKKKLKELADWLKTFIIEHLSIKNHVQVELGGIKSSGPP